MRWHEISEKLIHAMPLRARYSAQGQASSAKAKPLIAPPPMQQDPTTQIAAGLAQGIAPVVQGAISNAVAVDDAEEARLRAEAPANIVAKQTAENLKDDEHLAAIKKLAKHHK
jgi:hypothetical protein